MYLIALVISYQTVQTQEYFGGLVQAVHNGKVTGISAPKLGGVYVFEGPLKPNMLMNIAPFSETPLYVQAGGLGCGYSIFITPPCLAICTASYLLYKLYQYKYPKTPKTDQD